MDVFYSEVHNISFSISVAFLSSKQVVAGTCVFAQVKGLDSKAGIEVAFAALAGQFLCLLVGID